MPKECPVIVVTGDASGLGHVIVLHFAVSGYATVIGDIDRQRGAALQEEHTLQGQEDLFVATEVREEPSIKECINSAIEGFGHINVLVKNGIERYRRPYRYTLDEWQAIHETNLRHAFLCCTHAFPHLEKCRGKIITISLVQAFDAEKEISDYAAATSGLLELAHGMALDFALSHVRVNCICPGAIHTQMLDAVLVNELDLAVTTVAIGEKIPLGQVGQPLDIAQAAFFLASDQSSHITGTTLAMDGGPLARLSV
jgi:NAD(P)-dependent dehydrogenase (short-subunit alcohol dehydrogenase family)